MPEINQNIEMWAGEDVAIYVTLNDIDLSALSRIRWHLAETSDTEIPYVVKEIGTGITVDYNANTLRIDLDSIDTMDLGGNRYYHEIRVWDYADNHQATITIGRIKINPTTYTQVTEGS